VRAAHYLNQFFAGLGAEEAAAHEPVRLEGAVGPGRGLAAAGLEPNMTLACGDDRFSRDEAEILAVLLGWLDDEPPDVLVCGPSFGSGRYGYACGVLAREVGRRGIPVVAAMTPDSPGVLASEGAAHIVPTGANVAEMRSVLPRVAALALRLGNGDPVGAAEDEGYLPRGIRRNVRSDRTGAARAVDLLLSKIAGETRTEIAPSVDRVAPPPATPDLSRATLALVSEAGCVPQGNPDRLPSRRASGWLRYDIRNARSMDAGSYETVHAGFDTSAANEDPNRLVPLDVVRALEAEGRIGRVHPTFYTTTGVDTPVASATVFGREIAEELRASGVDVVLLTGT
jgi:glycine reductase complex component B subunit gamma